MTCACPAQVFPRTAALPRYNFPVDSIDLPFLRNAGMTWGLWKVLDHLLLRYFPDWWPTRDGAAAAKGAAAGSSQLDVQAVLRSEQFASACRELGDPDSAVMRALTALWAAGALGGESASTATADSGGGADLDAALGGLSLEEGLVVLTVLAHAAGSRA